MSVYLITGATGYIGSMLARHILCSEEGAEIVALVRDPEKAEALLGKNRVKLLKADLCDRALLNRVDVQCDYVFHCASVTKSAEMIAHPVEVTESIVNATQNVLELARRCSAKSIVYFSSMEVYGNIDCLDGHRVQEDEVGEIGLLNARSCYPLGKRMAENICYSYFKEYGVPVKIARLAQTFGAGILPTDNRVFAQFAKAVRNGTDIVLHTRGESIGNYCSIRDVIAGVFTILGSGVNGEAYNVVNERNTMQIRQMAELVAKKIAKGKIGVVYDIPESNAYGYAADTGLRMSGEKLKKLGWKPKDDLIKMYLEMLC